VNSPRRYDPADFEPIPMPGEGLELPLPRHTALEQRALDQAASGQMLQTQYGYAAEPEPMPPGAENAHPFPRDEHPAPVTVIPQRYDCYTTLSEKGIPITWRWNALDAEGLPLPESPAFDGSYLLIESPAQRDSCARFWNVTVWAYERQRLLTQAMIDAGDTIGVLQPELEVPQHYSRARVRIAWGAASGGTVRDVDIGEGIRIGVVACIVTIKVLYADVVPALIGPTAPRRIATPGLYLDTVFGAAIAQAPSTPGQQLATLTTTVRVPIGIADVEVPVPPGARRVTIMQTGAGNPATLEWRLYRTQIAGLVGPSMGTIILGAARRIDREDRPGAAGMITTGPADNTSDRILTFVWDLEI
jgi:hypothetical protein